ncbi:hypothetical protein K788_0006963 (plasmid) [Paraburkholderia caribensis MBA4]|uniref:Uncharacterized protein n=1 Tax=Paraburkholderia caribensis MBA4 TaxID=1323664 RepID=A0A0P0RQ81_9BURK|nr:hypothetical protein [Paraburkholderia caribensis]ALL70938.1 hypothetical protein K788_0006963 [Paraburkholderia caribensis MBA4]
MFTPAVETRSSAPAAPVPVEERDYDALVREGIALVPVHAPEWTDHNPSDPGITLIELLAYFTDALLYRTGRITPAAKLQFLRLLKGNPDFDIVPLVTQPDGTVDLAAELARAIDETVSAISQMECAVTPADFERFARAAAARELPGRPIGVRCIANVNLSSARMQGADAGKPARGHVSVVLALPAEVPDDQGRRVREAVSRDLASRCLMTTRLSVVAPALLHVSIGFAVAPLPGASREEALASIEDALARRFGGADAASFGGTLNIASIAMAIDAAPFVDYVEDVTVLDAASDPQVQARGVGVQIGAVASVGVDTVLGGPAHLSGDGFARFVRDSGGVLASVLIEPWEQLRLKVARERVSFIDGAVSARASRMRHGGDNHE